MEQFVWQRCLSFNQHTATSYHTSCRDQLVGMFPFEPDKVLDIGCGAGTTSSLIKQRYPQAQVWGIEPNRGAADLARRHLDKVLCGSFEELDLEAQGLKKGSVDIVLLADVLEHMTNPWLVLENLRPFLSERGRLIISLPNIRFLPLMDDLARGYWRYADSGILDITHVRFFTKQEIRRLCFETGYVIERIDPAMDPTLYSEFESRRSQLPCTIDTGKIVLKDIDEEELRELYAGQFYLVARPGPARLEGYAQPKMGCTFWSGQVSTYHQFLLGHSLERHEAEAFEQHLLQTGTPPRFEVILLSTSATFKHLASSLQNLSRQLYPGLHYTILGEGSTPAALAQQAHITWVETRPERLLNDLQQVLDSSTSDWSIVLQVGDQLVEHACLYLADIHQRHPDVHLIYTDEDQLTALGPDAPYFKPELCEDYLMAFPYLGEALMVRTDSLKTLGGVRPELGDAWGHDIALRILARFGVSAFHHIPDILYRRHPQRTFPLPQSPLPSGARRALADHLNERKISAHIEPGLLPGAWRIRRRSVRQPEVTLICQAPHTVDAARQLIEAHFIGRSYSPVRLIVLADPTHPQETLAYLGAADEAGVEGLQIFLLDTLADRPVEAINAAMATASSELIFLLPAGFHPSHPSWLEDLIAEAEDEGRGLIAPRCLTHTGQLTGNALILGCGDVATPFGQGEPHDSLGHFGRLLTPQNPGAVTLEAVLFRRALWENCGGFNPELSVSANAIDFSQKLRALGLRHLWTPHVSLIVSDPAPVNLSESDEEAIIQAWVPQLARDPGYNPNLSRKVPFAITDKPALTRLGLPWKPLPKVLAFPADEQGCGHYRVINPFQAAVKAQKIDGHCGFHHISPYELANFDPDTLYLQRQLFDGHIDFLASYRKFYSAKLVYELDDLITHLPKKSLHNSDLFIGVDKRLQRSLSHCDRFIVTTEALAHAYRKLHADIKVVPNRMDITRWGGLTSRRRTSIKPRVGWAGGLSHTGDLEMMTEVIRQTRDEVEWVFLGFCPEALKPLVTFIPGVPIPDYPATLASLNLDLAIAPIEENAFNECKSHLKLMEYGILGIPVIASDFGPYREAREFPIERVRNRPADWVKAIRSHVHDLDDCARKGDALREHVMQHWLLQDHLDEWMDAWFNF